jgi:hypothetical protein
MRKTYCTGMSSLSLIYGLNLIGALVIAAQLVAVER